MVYLIVGRTGSGKDYLAKKLMKEGLSAVKSYATRPKRTPDEDTHIFISPDEAASYTDRVAETKINGYEYFATKSQIEHADIYVIDPTGVDILTKNMPDTEFQIIYVKSNDMDRKINACKRAEDKIKEEQIFDKRNAAENKQFTEFENRIYHKMDEKVCFPSNVCYVMILDNDYEEKTADGYAKSLVTRKHLLANMTAIINDCVTHGIFSKGKEKDPNGNAKIIAVRTDDDGSNPEEIECTAENCASKLLRNATDFKDIICQYLAVVDISESAGICPHMKD